VIIYHMSPEPALGFEKLWFFRPRWMPHVRGFVLFRNHLRSAVIIDGYTPTSAANGRRRTGKRATPLTLRRPLCWQADYTQKQQDKNADWSQEARGKKKQQLTFQSPSILVWLYLPTSSKAL
jgi:hypothetical protein